MTKTTYMMTLGIALSCAVFAVGIVANTEVAMAQNSSQGALQAEIDRRAKSIEDQVVAWRRELHEHPELSNREYKTAELVAAHLTSLGIDVQTGVAHTGVVGVLKGGQPGPVVGLRADMDALPVVEETGLPFASKVVGEYGGEEVGVMHACGHDAHTSILLGVATVLSGMREQLPGTVKFVFQPAEEGPPAGEEGGAELMVEEGVLENPDVAAIFGLHVIPQYEVGQIAYRAGGMMASSDRLRIVVHGKQTHGAKPWLGVDPIVVSSQIIMALQTIPSRQLDATLTPSIVTVGSIHGGTRWNIIPDEVTMMGTIRTFDSDTRSDIHRRVKHTAETIAESAGATVEVEISEGIPVTFNDPDLTNQMTPTLERVVGAEKLLTTLPQTWAEDFSCYQQKIPGLYVYLGVRTPGVDREHFPTNHSPKFRVDEDALVIGVKTLSNLAVDYMQMQ